MLRFSGAWEDEQLNTHRANLLEYIEKNALETDGQPYQAFCNSPFVPPPLRRNEVLVKLSPEQLWAGEQALNCFGLGLHAS